MDHGSGSTRFGEPSPSRDPWQLFDDDGFDEPAAHEVDRMRSVLELLATTGHASHGDRAELQAAAECRLAMRGALPLERAIDSVVAAEAAGRPGWANYHAAEAASRLGRHELVIERLGRIPREFFAERDLTWRELRCSELDAIAHTALGNWDRASELVTRLAGRHAVQREDDELAPLNELTTALLSHLPTSRPLLAQLAATPAVVAGLRDDVVAALDAALAGSRR